MDAARASEIRDVTLPDGRRLRVRAWPGRGRPLVLRHGLFDDAVGWDALARDRRRPCWAIDLPGVRAATVAIAAAGRSPRGFAHRPVAFDGPVAVVSGARDALVLTAHIEALRRAVPHAHVEVWDGMGHHPQRERPVAVARFIERHASGRPRTPATAARSDAA